MKIGLFIPCYVDVVYPEVGVATYKLLKHLGLDVDYPLNQTCCGRRGLSLEPDLLRSADGQCRF